MNAVGLRTVAAASICLALGACGMFSRDVKSNSVATNATNATNAKVPPTIAMSPEKKNALDQSLATIAATPGRELASIAALAIRDGKVVYENAVGHRFIETSNAANHRAATPDTLYRIASISKMVVAIGMVKLVDEGKLDLDRDVSDYLGYSLRNPNFPSEKITLRLLVTHTSSLRDGGGYNFAQDVNLRDVLLPDGARYGKGEMWAKERGPGGYFNYCNFNFGVIANVMERATNERFDRLMERLLFGPMGIAATFDPASLSLDARARVATLYRKRSEIDGKEVWNSNGAWIAQVDDFSTDAPKPRATDAYVIGTNGSVFGPQGGLRISVRDLGKLMLMLMNGGVHEGKAVLSKRAVDLLLAEQWRYDKTAFGGKGNRAEDDEGEGGLFNAWSLGPQKFLDLSNGRTGDRAVEGGGFSGVGHLGNAYGLTSAFIFDPQTKNGLIFLVGGTAADPEGDKGQYSAFYRYEERILTALYRGALQAR
ncbi:MAG: serine hydrolase domain-containing protein [Casimicrobium sp.]